MEKSLLNESAQRELLLKIEEVLAENASSVKKGWSHEKDGYVFGNYIIWIYDAKTDWIGLAIRSNVDPDSEKDLQFTTFSPRSGVGMVAAAFVSIDGSLRLVHDGRVYTRDHRPKPHSSRELYIGKKRYFEVSNRVLSPDFAFDLIAFQESRKNPNLGVAKQQGGPDGQAGGIDLGAQLGGYRQGGDFEAWHAPIVAALWQHYEAKGYSISTSSIVRPDLLVEKGSEKLLFEVKPFASFGSICAAIGQICCYAQANNPTAKFIVSEVLDFSVPHTPILDSVMKANSIKYLSYSRDLSGNYTFHSGQ